jgi:6-phosphogluconolactonase
MSMCAPMHMPAPVMREYASGDALAEALAAHVRDALADAITKRGRAVLAVSGGSTPVKFFQALSKLELAWEQVTVMLVDERMVPASHERSNAKLVRENLLQNKAANAFFVPMYSGAFDEGDAAHQIETVMKRAQLVPADILILGMGNDGHTASFFPGGDHLADAIDPQQEALVLPMHADGAGETRLTLTLPVLLAARQIALHIEGQGKRDVLDRARADGTRALDMPVRAVFENAVRPVRVFWAG